MVGLFSFLFLASLIALAVAVVLLVVRAVKKKPKKPVAVVAGVSLLVCLVSFVVVGTTYQPTPEQIAERERAAAEKAEQERLEAEAAAQREAEAAQSESQAQTPEPSAPSEIPEQSEPVSPSVPAESEPPAESENSAHSDAPATSSPAEPEPSSSENPLRGGYDSLAEKILYNAQISECPVMNGSKTERIGSYGRIIMSKDDMKSLTSEQAFTFAQDVICSFSGEYNWFTIKMNDGTGMVFSACGLAFDYGVLGRDGLLEERLGSGFMNDDMDAFEYFTLEEIEAME